jgi:hypothetical protein
VIQAHPKPEITAARITIAVSISPCALI